MELCNYLGCMVAICAIFHKLSISPIKVKFSECYSYVSKNLRTI
jgi:hypothetical protein